MRSILLTLLLIGILTLAFTIQRVKASGTIYIRSNGKVDPPTAPISTVDNIIYTFTDDIKYPTYLGIVIERNNIVVNGNGHKILGSGDGDGFSLSNISNVTIKNVNVEEFSYGIFTSSSININISKSSIANNENGLYFDSSTNDKISKNDIKTNNGAGILLINHSSTSTVNGNNITNNYFGIYLSSSSNSNTITDNNITANRYYGIILDTSASNDISRNNIKANNDGIGLLYSSNNKLRNNILVNNTYNFDLWGLTVTDFVNDVDASNTVDNKKIYYWANKQDATIPLDAGYVSLVNCTRITVQNLNLTKNEEGILLAYTKNSTIIQNDITSNYIGIRLRNSSGNSIYHNSLINNINQVNTYDSQNAWDNGYPSGGNYWNDLTTMDLFRGVHQNELGSDGISDTPWIVDSSNKDNYPLIKPYGGSFDIGITDIKLSKTIVSLGYSPNITVRVLNYGIRTENFNLTVYANTTVIQEITNIALTSRNSTEVVFNWQISGFTKGNYTIKAYAHQVPSEIDTKDNTLVDGWIFVLASGQDVAIKGLSCRAVVEEKFTSPIEVTAMNVGNYKETFNVTVHVNETSIGFQTITLESGAISILTFTWNTSSFVRGNYRISAYASAVPGETDLGDNNCTGGSVQITKVGDLGGGSPVPQFFQCDGKCDSQDIPLFLQCYRGTAPPDAMYLGDLGSGAPVPQFFACDGKCDSQDIPLFLRCYRGTGP